jgi:hypothetical protein
MVAALVQPQLWFAALVQPQLQVMLWFSRN